MSSRNLKRMAADSTFGWHALAAAGSNGSSDWPWRFLPAVHKSTSPRLLAVVEATEEAFLNSLLRAMITPGNSHMVDVLPLDAGFPSPAHTLAADGTEASHRSPILG